MAQWPSSLNTPLVTTVTFEVLLVLYLFFLYDLLRFLFSEAERYDISR